jgi:hypothetical protein
MGQGKPFRNIQIAQFAGHLGIVDHAGAYKSQPAVVTHSSIDHLLHARNQRGKAGQDNAPAGILEDLVNA